MEAAQALIARAVAAAQTRHFRMAVAIVEPSGELVAFVRMDDTQYGSIFVAQKKASTAARYRLATSVMEERTLAGRTVTLANEDSLPIAGGIPIVVDGKIVGAIGVSGAAASEDNEIARAALGQ
jgi:glc operon protein GlcG